MNATPVTDFAARPQLPVALSPERLAALIEGSAERADGMLFTATPREELSEIGDWQRLGDLAFAGKMRAIVAAWNRASEAEREFAGDEVALAVGVAPMTGARLVGQACALAELPGLLEAVEGGALTERHALAVLRELDRVTLTLEQRQAVVLMALGRLDGQTPRELEELLRRLVLQIDPVAARDRRDQATQGRHVRLSAAGDGQGDLHAHGRLEQLAAVKARLTAELDREQLHPDDTRTREQREYDLLVELLTRGTLAGQPVPEYAVQVVVPFSTATGGDLELAELPGYGPILPSTARELLHQAGSLSRLAVDPDGTVIAVSDPIRLERDPVTDTEAPRDIVREALRAMTHAPQPHDLSTRGYRVPSRLARLVKARNRTCVFPGCHRRVTDTDHRIPWPLGPTHPDNLQCLCRRHHRAKQALFEVHLQPDGTTTWTTRGGWQFHRRPRPY
jgi:hypothetical protein